MVRLEFFFLLLKLRKGVVMSAQLQILDRSILLLLLPLLLVFLVAVMLLLLMLQRLQEEEEAAWSEVT